MVLSTLAMMMFAMANAELPAAMVAAQATMSTACNPQCYLDNYGDLRAAYGYKADGTDETDRSVVYGRAMQHWITYVVNGDHVRSCACQPGSPRGPASIGGTGAECSTGYIWNGVKCVNPPAEESTGTNCDDGEGGNRCTELVIDVQEDGRRLSQ